MPSYRCICFFCLSLLLLPETGKAQESAQNESEIASTSSTDLAAQNAQDLATQKAEEIVGTWKKFSSKCDSLLEQFVSRYSPLGPVSNLPAESQNEIKAVSNKLCGDEFYECDFRFCSGNSDPKAKKDPNRIYFRALQIKNNKRNNLLKAQFTAGLPAGATWQRFSLEPGWSSEKSKKEKQAKTYRVGGFRASKWAASEKFENLVLGNTAKERKKKLIDRITLDDEKTLRREYLESHKDTIRIFRRR